MRKLIGWLMLATPFIALIAFTMLGEYVRFGWSGAGHVALVLGVMAGIAAWFALAAMLTEARRP